jgi:hypothetical protein
MVGMGVYKRYTTVFAEIDSHFQIYLRFYVIPVTSEQSLVRH